MAKDKDSPQSFNELMNTPIDFTAFVMNRLKIENLTQETLVVNDRLDWNNPEGNVYPFDLNKPLPLIKDDRGRQVIPVDYFINNDLLYLQGESASRKYATSTTKTKAAMYDNIKGIEDIVPNLWKSYKSSHDGFLQDEYCVTHLDVDKWFDYRHMKEITIRREDQELYTFKEGDFPRLNLRDIEDLLLLLRVEDLQLGVESYQKKLNITMPQTFKAGINKLTPFTAFNDPPGIIYQDKNWRMEYLPKRDWSRLDRQRSLIMFKKIDELLFERRLYRNLERFVGGREYGNEFRLLERTI
ncbi:hypothetical protein Tco_0988503 [Tanacetum coccineum]|uniref:Uncharacterized protein n=1 Tax=Tanacetum coccineum TaxID=301880 RepID=A0ABQ5ER38_9ASTR